MEHHRLIAGPAARERPASDWDSSSTTMRVVARVKPGDAVGCAVASALHAGLSRIVSREANAKSCDPEGVHRLRVATRRLRSELRALEGWVEQQWRERVGQELKWLAGILGAVRDLDVLITRLRKALREDERAGDKLESLAPLFEDLQLRRARAASTLTDGLRSDRYRRLLAHLARTAQIPVTKQSATEPCRSALPLVAITAWRRLAKAARRLRPETPVEEFHEVRKRTKRARYTAEFVTHFLDRDVGRRAARFIRSTTQLQELLGEHQDSVVAAAEVERGLAEHRTDPGFTQAAEQLLETQRVAAQVARTAFFKIWSELDRKKRRRWLKVGAAH
jgi:CHAD domain-containing protein